jgi:hypothetical protein
MASKRKQKSKRRILKRRARPLQKEFRKRNSPATPPPTASPTPSTRAETPSAESAEEQHVLERVHFYIRHRPNVRMDDLVATMRQKYGMTSEQTFSAVETLQQQKAVRVHYPNFDRSDATVSALWQE